MRRPITGNRMAQLWSGAAAIIAGHMPPLVVVHRAQMLSCECSAQQQGCTGCCVAYTLQADPCLSCR